MYLWHIKLRHRPNKNLIVLKMKSVEGSLNDLELDEKFLDTTANTGNDRKCK